MLFRSSAFETVGFNHFNVLNTTDFDFIQDFPATALTNIDMDAINISMLHESMDLDAISSHCK